MNANDLVGYLLLNNRFIKNRRAYWNCTCTLCNSVKDMREDTLKRGTTVSCGCYKKSKEFAKIHQEINPIEDLTGNIYSELEVLYLSPNRVGRKIMWTCRCSCGNIIDVWAANLKNGNTKSCGSYIHRKDHMKNMWDKTFEDLTGQTFGDWIVIKRDGNNQPTRWICKCTNCNTIKSVLGSSLKNGESTSCGCHRYNDSLEGQRIGHWLIRERSKRLRPNGHYCTTYLCECDCGTKRYVDENRLLSGKSLSCGCCNSKGNEYIASILKENNYNFESEYSFSELTGPNNGLLRFDFAIKDNDNNVICLIEYQGQQHFSNAEFGRTQREITDVQKKEFCKKNNISLYEIRYNENIDESLEKILSHITC